MERLLVAGEKGDRSHEKTLPGSSILTKTVVVNKKMLLLKLVT